MLGSMSPLGERARNSKWLRTVGYYFVGSMVGGLVLGGLLGSFGAVLPLGSRSRAGSVAFFAIAAALLESDVLGLELPTPHRQVDDQWLYRYRPWVYGLGFGVQLGLGVVTIVETWAMYFVLGAEFLSGSLLLGALVGLTFGLARAFPILVVAGVRDTGELLGISAHLQGTEVLSRRFTSVGLATLGLSGGIMVVVSSVHR
jgi:hypothetical protein